MILYLLQLISQLANLKWDTKSDLVTFSCKFLLVVLLISVASHSCSSTAAPPLQWIYCHTSQLPLITIIEHCPLSVMELFHLLQSNCIHAPFRANLRQSISMWSSFVWQLNCEWKNATNKCIVVVMRFRCPDADRSIRINSAYLPLCRANWLTGQVVNKNNQHAHHDPWTTRRLTSKYPFVPLWIVANHHSITNRIHGSLVCKESKSCNAANMWKSLFSLTSLFITFIEFQELQLSLS